MRPTFSVVAELRKMSATYYDAHIPESSIEILGQSVGGITDRHYTLRVPLAFKAIMTLPQPMSFSALVRDLYRNARAAGDGSPTPLNGS